MESRAVKERRAFQVSHHPVPAGKERGAGGAGAPEGRELHPEGGPGQRSGVGE